MTRDAYHKKHVPHPRFDAILQVLDGGRAVPLADIARRLNVVERTVRRDIDALRDMGYDIDKSGGVVKSNLR